MSRFSLLYPLDDSSNLNNSDHQSSLSSSDSDPAIEDRISLAAGLDYFRRSTLLANQLDLECIQKRRTMLEKSYRIVGFHYQSYCESESQSGIQFFPSHWLNFRDYLEIQVSLGECLLQIGRIFIASEHYESILADSLFIKSVEHLKRSLYMNDESIANEQQIIEYGLTNRNNESMEFSQWINKFWSEIQYCEILVQRRLEELENKLEESRNERDIVKQRIGEERWRKGPSKISDASSYAQTRDELMKKISLIKSVQELELITAKQNLPPPRQ